MAKRDTAATAATSGNVKEKACCGGLRTRGHVKEIGECPLISVITVVFNGAEQLERTIQSVLGQTYPSVEFIVIDGASKDGTVDIIQKYGDRIDYWVSEEDGGIFDAMNKGISRATGAWVNFMNAGDTFVDGRVLENIDFGALSEYALIYGNRVQGGIAAMPKAPAALEAGVIHANHQSMFFNAEVLKEELRYEPRYKIYADYELVNRIYLKFPEGLKYVNVSIADFEPGGVSSVVSAQKRKDKYRIVFRHYGVAGLFRAMWYRVFHR